MSTAAKTSRSSSASDSAPSSLLQKKRKTVPLGYIPGQPVTPPVKRQKKGGTRRKAGTWSLLPDEVLEKIILHLANDRQGLSVMLLSMVNRNLRQEVQGNSKVWHMLYLHWRGHLSSQQTGGAQEGQAPLTRMIRSPQGAILKLNPSVPRSLPNFRIKPPSLG